MKNVTIPNTGSLQGGCSCCFCMLRHPFPIIHPLQNSRYKVAHLGAHRAALDLMWGCWGHLCGDGNSMGLPHRFAKPVMDLLSTTHSATHPKTHARTQLKSLSCLSRIARSGCELYSPMGCIVGLPCYYETKLTDGSDMPSPLSQPPT